MEISRRTSSSSSTVLLTCAPSVAVPLPFVGCRCPPSVSPLCSGMLVVRGLLDQVTGAEYTWKVNMFRNIKLRWMGISRAGSRSNAG